jgi:hypothetical protein
MNVDERILVRSSGNHLIIESAVIGAGVGAGGKRLSTRNVPPLISLVTVVAVSSTTTSVLGTDMFTVAPLHPQQELGKRQRSFVSARPHRGQTARSSVPHVPAHTHSPGTTRLLGLYVLR